MKRVLSWVLAIVFGFSAFYVAYAHFASVVTAKQYFETPLVETFANEAELRKTFEVRGDVKLAGGEAHVTSAAATDGFVGFETRVIALTESRIAMRFKVDDDAPYEVFVGMATRDSREAIRYGLHNEAAAPYYAWAGDPLKTLPGLRRPGMPSESIDDKGRTPFGREGIHQWHDLELQISTSLHRISAFVDGVPTGSVFVDWIAGLPVRFQFGLRSLGQDRAPVNVSFSKLVFEPRAGDSPSLDFTDGFDGKVIDPRHWAVYSLQSDFLSVSLAPTKNGLAAKGRATPLVQSATPAFLLDSPSFPLGTVHASAVVRVRELRHALFFMGISSALGGPHLRIFDVGIHEDTEKKSLVGTVSGHWGRDGQSRFDPARHWADSDTITLTVDYDAATRTARAKMDGFVIGEHVSDLQMREHVRVRFGVVLDDATGSFDLDVKELRLRAHAD